VAPARCASVRQALRCSLASRHSPCKVWCNSRSSFKVDSHDASELRASSSCCVVPLHSASSLPLAACAISKLCVKWAFSCWQLVASAVTRASSGACPARDCSKDSTVLRHCASSASATEKKNRAARQQEGNRSKISDEKGSLLRTIKDG